MPLSKERNRQRMRQLRLDTFVQPKVEAMLPNLRYVELFARRPYSDKWQVWGNGVV